MVRAPGERGAGLAWRRGDCKRMSVEVSGIHDSIITEHDLVFQSWIYSSIEVKSIDGAIALKQYNKGMRQSLPR